MEIEKIKKFYTIQKKFFDYYNQKLKDITIRLYSYWYMPPTMWSVIWTDRISIIPWKMWLELKEQSEETKKMFAENIKAQSEIMRIIQKRNEDFWYTCWLIKLETGVWKTNLAIQITHYYNTNTLILVSNKKLLRETIDKFKEFTNFIPYQYGWWKKEIWQLTVCTKKSFILDQTKLKDFWLIIIDELHEQFTENFRFALNRNFDWKWVALYGMSWTPYTQDLEIKELEKYFWKLIDLQIGYSVIPEFTFLNYHNSIDYNFETYHKLKEQLFEDKIRFEKQIEYLEKMKQEHNYILILSDRISEITRLYEKYEQDKDFYTVLITGKTKIEDDTEKINKALKSWKKILIIGSITKIWTWFNMPILDTLFLISSINFSAKVIQAVGRILRKHSNKTDINAYIWNDEILKKQKNEKLKVVIEEYWVKKEDIKQIEINKLEDNVRNLVQFNFTF